MVAEIRDEYGLLAKIWLSKSVSRINSGAHFLQLFFRNILFSKMVPKFWRLGTRIVYIQQFPLSATSLENLTTHIIIIIKKGIVESDFAAAMSLYHGFDLLQQHGMRPFYNFMLKTAGEMPKSPGSPSASTGFSPGLLLPKFKSCFSPF